MPRSIIAKKKKKKMAKSTLLKKLYIIDRFCASRSDPVTGKLQILVKWKDFPFSASTWEPYDQLVEDGFKYRLKLFQRRQQLIANASGQEKLKHYLFVLRFCNVKGHSNVYQRLNTFLTHHKATTSSLHIPGNIHVILELDPTRLDDFTSQFRVWLENIRPVECFHAQLWPISSAEGPVALSVYPPIQ